MREPPASRSTPLDLVRPLLRVRQVREFTSEPLAAAELEAITQVARWSGSSSNSQAWRFIAIRDAAILRRLAEAGHPQTRPLRTAPAAVAIVLPAEKGRQVSHAYDEGRAAERILVAAYALGLAAGITWIRSDAREAVRGILGLPADRFARTVVALGHPTDAARRPKSAPGQARLPRDELIFEERWPQTERPEDARHPRGSREG